MGLVRGHAFVDHRHANIGNKLLNSARVLARTLRRYALSPTQVARKSDDYLDRLVAANEIGQTIEVG